MKELSKEVKDKHNRYLWTVFISLFLGLWLFVSQYALGYTTYAMKISDSGTGAIVILSSLVALKPNRLGFVSLWVICFAGLWLNFAPLLFWAKGSVEYLNDTLVGIFLVLFSVIIPGIPGKVEVKGGAVPLGWSYNPSSWAQRIPVIALGILGMLISRYLAAYQLGYIQTVWDPVFGEGTKEVITSTISKSFPIPDAGLGCFAYTIEVLLGLKGGENRWKTMPWMVMAFVLLVVPLGVVSIILVILQPLIVKNWCFLCLCTATAMMIMIVFAVDELIAVFQFLHQNYRAGKGFWKTFFSGGDLKGAKDDEELFSTDHLIKKGSKGVSLCWNLLLAAAIGAGFMITPALFSFAGTMGDINHLCGALIVVVSILSLAEVIRICRWVNMIMAAVVIVGSWVLYSYPFYHTLLGLLLILLSIRKGKIKESYGPWQKMIR